MHIRELRERTIAVRLPNWVGDAVMSTPALRALARANPTGRLVALGTGTVCRLLAGQPGVHELVGLPKKADPQGPEGLRRKLQDLEVEAAVVLPHSFSSAWQLRRAGLRRLAGWATLERRLLLEHAPWPPRMGRRRIPRPMPHHYQELLGTLGVRTAGEALELAVEEADRRSFRSRLAALGIAEGEPYFCVNPGASFGPSKQWTQHGFVEVIHGLRERTGARTLVLCGPGEEQTARAIGEAAGDAAVDVSRPVLSLGELKAALESARALVTTDAGPRHVATAFGVPVVVVMGATDPRYTDCNLERTRVLRVDVECSPCHSKVCPIDHRCMTRLSSEWVLRELEALLAEHSGDRESVHA